jgi:CheY-like chemotaxis protein
VNSWGGDVKILLVEDESSCRIATVMLLQHLGCSVDAVASGKEALARFDPATHQIVVTDQEMPGLLGQDLAAMLKRKSPATPVVMYTGAVNANLECVDALITKPGSITDFREMLSRLAKSSSANSSCEKRDSVRLPQRPQRVKVRE